LIVNGEEKSEKSIDLLMGSFFADEEIDTSTIM
jgi:hypothetical protein